MKRHIDAVKHIQLKYTGDVHIYGEGFGGFVAFYLAIAGVSVRSIICENSPAILTEKTFHKAMRKDGSAGRRRMQLLPVFRVLVRLFPALPVPIKAYLAWDELIDFADEHNRKVEVRIVNLYHYR